MINKINLEQAIQNTNIKNWPSTYKLNTCNACTTYPDNIDTTFTTDIDGTKYSKEKTLVKHDYIRWLGFKLFSSLHSSGLFSNENQMNEELAEQGERLFYEYIKFKLDYISTQSTRDCMFLDEIDDTTNPSNLNANNKVDANYLTNHTDEKYNGFGVDDGYGPSSNEVVNNITKTLFEQIIKTQPERFQNINSGQNPPFGPNSAIDPQRTRSGENTLDSSYNRIPLPFAEGDSITFNITILPSLGQSKITSDPFLTDEDLYRTYHIKLLLTDEPINNPIPNFTITTFDIEILIHLSMIVISVKLRASFVSSIFVYSISVSSTASSISVSSLLALIGVFAFSQHPQQQHIFKHINGQYFSQAIIGKIIGKHK